MTSLCDGVGVVDENGSIPAAQPGGAGACSASAATPAARTTGSGTSVCSEPDSQKPFPIDEMPLIRALRGEASDGVEMVVRNPSGRKAF